MMWSDLLENNIVKIIFLLSILTMLILYFVGIGYSMDLYFKSKRFNDYTTTQKDLMKMSSILSIILVVFCLIYGGYRLYHTDFFKNLLPKSDSGVKSLASSILSEKDPVAYDAKCDAIFGSDPSLNEQYTQMKAQRPQAEVRNLCGNFAKNVLGRKV